MTALVVVLIVLAGVIVTCYLVTSPVRARRRIDRRLARMYPGIHVVPDGRNKGRRY